MGFAISLRASAIGAIVGLLTQLAKKREKKAKPAPRRMPTRPTARR